MKVVITDVEIDYVHAIRAAKLASSKEAMHSQNILSRRSFSKAGIVILSSTIVLPGCQTIRPMIKFANAVIDWLEAFPVIKPSSPAIGKAEVSNDSPSLTKGGNFIVNIFDAHPTSLYAERKIQPVDSFEGYIELEPSGRKGSVKRIEVTQVKPKKDGEYYIDLQTGDDLSNHNYYRDTKENPTKAVDFARLY